MKRELVNKKTVDEKENDTKLTLRSSSDVLLFHINEILVCI